MASARSASTPTPYAPVTDNPATLPYRFCTPRHLLIGVSITFCVNTLIALGLWLNGRGPFDVQMVYSQCIGLTIWALTNAGAVLISRPSDPGGFPRGWRLVLLVLTCTGTGVAVGITLGGFYEGVSSWKQLTQNPVPLAKFFGLSLGVGLGMTVYFYLEGKKTYLEVELERTQRQAAEARLKLLESQLEPHMMFNTLANLRVLIGLDPVRAQAMLDHMVAYLRSTLSASRSGTHTLQTEFERLNDYLALMAVRMGPRLQHTLTLPDALRSVPVPPLLLQPLVENAIQHGLEPHVGNGQLEVTAESDGPTLRLRVRDSGVGLDAPQGTSAVAAHHSGFGLTQVSERLRTTYGDQASFDLYTDTNGWTCADIALPFSPAATPGAAPEATPTSATPEPRSTFRG